MLSPLSNTYRLHESSVSIYQIDASSPEYLIASVVAGAKIQVSPDLLTSNPSYAKNGVPKPIGYDVSLEAKRWSFSGNNIKLNNLYVDKKLNIYIRLDATPVTGSTGLIVITPNDYDIDGYFIEKIEEDGSAASSVVAETTRTEEDGVEEVLNRPGYRYVMENVGSEEEPDMQKKQKDSDYFYICIGNIYTENGLRKYVIDNGSYNTQYQIDKDKDSNAMFELTKSLSGNHVIRPLMPFLELTIDGTLTIGGVAVNSIINDDQMQKFVKAWNDNKPSDMEDWTLDETIVTTQALITYITYITSHFLRKDAPDATPYALGVGSLVSAGDMSAAGSISSSAKVLTPVIESSNDDKVLYAKDIIDVAKRVVADAVSAHFSNDLSLNGKVFIDAEGGMRHADFTPDIITGQRWSLNGLGEGEFESLVLRSFLRVPMLDFNKVTVSSGTSWNAPGCGVIKSVGVGDDGCDFFDIKLERGEIGSFVKGDICMGVWHFEGEDSRLNASDGDAKNDDSGTSVAGFCKVLFMITEVEDYVADGVSYTNGRCHVGYRLLDGAAHGHVAESMTVVAYGHDITLDSVPGRLSSEQVNGDNFMFPDELDFMSNERTRSWYKTTKFQRYLVNMNGGTFMHLRDKNNAYVEDDGVSYNDESKYRIEVLDGKRYVFVRYKKSKWDIAFPYNVGMHLGDTTDMYVDDVKTGGKVALSNYSAFLSNVYFYGFLQHIDISQLSDTEGLLASTNYQVDLTSSSATVNVDADGGLQLFDETGRALVQTAVYVHRGDSPMIYIDDFSDAAWSKEAERLGIAEVSEKDKRDYYRLMVAVDGIGSLDSQGALIEGSGYSKEGTSVTVKAILASAVAKGSASVTFTVLPYKSDVALQKIFFIKFTYDGSVGLSVFTSYVFKRFTWGLSADSIAVPEGGSFTSPLPSTGGWSDSIPEGEGEVWMAQRRFYSDGSEADGGEHANAWVLARMTDTEFLDVEFTAAEKYKPLLYADGSPVHGNSEEALARKKQLGWVEAVDGANAIWMATSHYADGKWSEWNYVKVKGENGDPGLSVFTSYVFKRFAIGTSADSITVPQGGSFTSPLPSTGGWSDSIPEGEGEVWMAQRRFYSDGSEADGGEHANAWVLARMTDTEFLDVEFTAAEKYKPLLYADGSPVHGNSEEALARKKQLGWVEAVDGANAIWMATSHYADGKWSEWNYVKVKGENGEPGEDGLPGRPGEDGLPGADGVSALTASVTPSSIVIDCDSEGRSKEAGNRTFSFHVFDGDSQTESYTVAYGSIASCFQLNASLNKLAWSKGSSIVSASIDISISCKDRTVHLSVPVVANKQGASSLGQMSKMARNRGAFSSLQTYFNNEFWSDYVRVGSSYIFFLGDSVERWDGREGKYYYKGGSGLATESLYPSASASGDIMDGGRVIWKRVSNVGDLAAGRIIADSINSGNANIGEVFIGKTSTGAVDIQGGVSVDDSADGWLIQSGRIVHTKTGLSLTSDGYLDNPDGLHLSVSGKPTNAVLPPSANMLPDPILNNPRHFGYDEDKKAIPVHGIGTTSSDYFWATSLVQTGSSSTFLNFTSPWADDGGRVVSFHFGADYVPSQSKYVHTWYVKSNRAAILTSIPLDGSSDMKQRNIYTFSVWAKNASADFLFNTLVEARVFVSALGNECSWIYLGIERSTCGGGVRMIASGIASEIDGWVQHYVTFEVVFGSSAQSGSATYAEKAYFDWMPYVNAKKKNMYVSFAGAKLEKGDKPTPMTYLSGSLKRAGIDILKGEIVLTADKFLCQNLEGEKTAWLDDTGVFMANGVFTSPVNIIDWNNNVGRDKIIVAFKDEDGNFLGYLDNNGNDRSMSGEIADRDEWVIGETVVYLDVLRLGETVKILSLPADAIGSGGSGLRFLEFPYYIDGELNCRTLTRLNGKSDSVPRLITGDEMRMLGGKRITLLLKDAVPTPYTLAQCFFLSYASSYLSPDLQTANATYVYQYPHGGMVYDGKSGMGLNGDRVVTLECRAAFFYDVKAVGSGNKSCYGYAWVSSRDETLTQFGNNLDNWN
mgnify:CR=1 FL=1